MLDEKEVEIEGEVVRIVYADPPYQIARGRREFILLRGRRVIERLPLREENLRKMIERIVETCLR